VTNDQLDQDTDPLPEAIDFEAFAAETENSLSLAAPSNELIDTEELLASPVDLETFAATTEPAEILSPAETVSEATDKERYVDTERWIDEWWAEVVASEDITPAEKLPDNIACFCGAKLKVAGKTYKCQRCDTPLPIPCRECGRVLLVTESGHATCLGCGLGYVFDASKRRWLSDLDPV